MPRGGARTGAGRKPKREVKPEGQTPLEYMLSVMHDNDAEPARRDRMAIAAAPYMHERVGDTAVGKKEQRADRAQIGHIDTEWDAVVQGGQIGSQISH